MVGRVGSAGGIAAPRRASRTGGGFSLPATRDAAAASAAAPVAAPLLLQAAGPVEPPDARAARHARAALDELTGLQIDLLRGNGDPGRLERLAALAESGGTADDPVLREAAAAIALRARIELARRRRAVS